jgi:small subunit ribosomal protein S24e
MGEKLHGKDGEREKLRLELTATKYNALIGRKEINFKIVEASTPKRVDVRQELANTLETEIDKVYIRHMGTVTGTRLTEGLAHIYDEIEAGKQFEPTHIIERNKVKETPSE